MDPIILVLGDFIFQDMEIPESINFGGAQLLSVKKLIGGGRVIDAMGKDPDPPQWSGTFFPSLFDSALDRALVIQGMKDSGLPLLLSYDQILLMVLISKFEPDYQLGHIPYKITLEVLDDLTAPVSINPFSDITAVITADVNSIVSLAAAVNSAIISNTVTNFAAQVAAVASFDNASYSDVAPIIQAASAALTAVDLLSATTDTTLSSVSTPGGIMPSTSPAANLAAFEAQLAANNQQTGLVQLQGLFGRVIQNLNQANSSERTITVGGGNLYDVAAKQYGDPTAWVLIAQANGLTDPTLAGITVLTIPPYNNSSGGVLTS
jgi:hypothetical protein